MASGKDNQRPIIIVKKKKKGGHEHHGGAWKVAYADFVTAMMAFFLVMWLVTAVSKEQRAAIFDYFKNPSMEPGKSSRPAPGQMGPGGASTSPINLGGGLNGLSTSLRKVKDMGASKVKTNQPLTAEELAAEQREAEHKHLESLMVELREAVSKSQALEPFKDQLLLDITPDGVRIQIVDAQNRPMFDVGSARLRDYTVAILHELAPYLDTVPNRVSLTGHTDIRPYPSNKGYTNWELSADRANAARRALVAAGLPDSKVSRVVGLSSSVLFNKNDPQSPVNRRISIVVMTKQAEEAALKTDVASDAPSPNPDGTPVVNTGGTPPGNPALPLPQAGPIEPPIANVTPIAPGNLSRTAQAAAHPN